MMKIRVRLWKPHDDNVEWVFWAFEILMQRHKVLIIDRKINNKRNFESNWILDILKASATLGRSKDQNYGEWFLYGCLQHVTE